MSFTELIFTTVVVLLGMEGTDYIIFERDMDEWQVVDWVHRN